VTAAATWLLCLLAATFFFGGPTDMLRGEDMELYYRRQAAADPASLTETAKIVAARQGASIPVEVTQIWVESLRDDGGYLYVQTAEGRWYSGWIYWRGSRWMVFNNSGEALTAPPDLSGGVRLK
jgi:hypothetical protein